MNRIRIGWELTEGVFEEQIEVCQDSKKYVTLWTHHKVNQTIFGFSSSADVCIHYSQLNGAALAYRDMSGRPSFRKDVSGMDRFFPEFTQTDING